jgi:hypothetical protein
VLGRELYSLGWLLLRVVERFRLDEVGIDLWAEGRAEGDDKRRETFDRFVVRKQVHGANH